MMNRRGRTISMLLSMLVLAGCGWFEASAAPVVLTCTAQNIAGYPYSGTLCAGWTLDDCTPGLVYNCIGGPRGTQNNCTLQTTCSTGCLSGANSTPVTVNTSTPTANDACFFGSAPLTLSSSSVVGGNDVTFTATLQATHNPYAVVNLQQLGTAIAQPCVVPIELPSSSTSISIPLPTAVVTSQTQASPWALLNYTDSSGANRNLVSLAQSLTINSGGSALIPPLASFVIDNTLGNPITTIPGGSNVIANATLSGPAPFGGVTVAVASNPTSAFTTILNPTIPASCTSTTQQQTNGTLTATSGATSNISATLTASDGTGSPLSETVTITPPPLTIANVILNPTSVVGGGSLIATVTLNRVVLSSDPSSTVSVRVSEGEPSGAQIATFAGCTGSPACTGPLTIPIGASSASVTITTSTVTSQQFVTVAASATWSQQSASANFTVNTGSCTPNTCAGLGFSCGTASDGCGGTLNCGTCTAPAVCSSNVCCTPETCAGLGFSCGTASDGCGGTLNCGTCSSGQTCTNNVCASCTPNTCSGLGFNCGSASDGCGGTLSCGTCSSGQTCTNNVCTTSVTLASLSLSPTSVRGGNSSTGTVTLSGAAPAGGAVVSLGSSDTSVATVPSSVTVAAGNTSASFTVSTQRVSSNKTVTISATYGGATKTASLTVTSRH